jgi:hypothetical protein
LSAHFGTATRYRYRFFSQHPLPVSVFFHKKTRRHNVWSRGCSRFQLNQPLAKSPGSLSFLMAISSVVTLFPQ